MLGDSHFADAKFNKSLKLVGYGLKTCFLGFFTIEFKLNGPELKYFILELGLEASLAYELLLTLLLMSISLDVVDLVLFKNVLGLPANIYNI